MHSGFLICFSDNASVCIPGSAVFLCTILVDGIPGTPPPPGLGLDASNGGISQIFPRVINWNNLTVNTGFLGLRVGDHAVVHMTQETASFNPATPTPNR